MSQAKRVINFSAGPATLPLPVLEQIQSEMIVTSDWGMSILEMSHRDPRFVAVLQEAKSRLRRLLALPEDFDILFLQGGSRLQFSMVPLNLAGTSGGPAEYVVSGSWGRHALTEAARLVDARAIWDGRSTNFDRLPAEEAVAPAPEAAYVHFTSNETIQGVQFREMPSWGEARLVCDASSDFLSRPIDFDRIDLLYACAQKNAGPAGVTVVLIRRERWEGVSLDERLPSYLSYAHHASSDSLWNTPPTFGIYVVNLICRWLEEEIGGLAAMARRNAEKAALLYEVLDAFPDRYIGHAVPSARSHMNVTFRLWDEEREAAFLSGAAERGLVGLKGHRSVGGIRASIYNAMSMAGVESLAAWMRTFVGESG